MTDVLRIAIAGSGRMGQAIAAQVVTANDADLVGVWSRNPARDEARFPAGTSLSPDIDALVDLADVLIDFSLPAGTVVAAGAAAAAQTPLVSGVSGLDAGQLAAVHAAGQVIPVVYDRNMSQGVALLGSLAERAAASLGSDFSIAIDETHHVHKIDAPSGTALKLGEAVAGARGRSLADVMWYEQDGEPPRDAVSFHVERRGEVAGDHRIRFESANETLTLAHSVTSRAVFAAGALRAARWVMQASAGVYGMRDVLHLQQ